MQKIAALIPAAGYSSRLGDFKPLLPVGRSTVIEEAVGRFRLAGIEDVRVVIGHRAAEISPVLDRLGVRRIFNPDYARGMLSSVLAGLKSLEPVIDAFFLLPADIALVKPATIKALAGVYRSSGATVVYPRFEGLRGHPPLISRDLPAKDLPRDYEGGLRTFLSRFEDRAFDVDVPDQAILMDCDTKVDYFKLCAYRLRDDIPTVRECLALLSGHGASNQTIGHCRMVAGLARLLAVHLGFAGFAVNIDLVTAAGLLHDMAKGQADHAQAGAEVLEKLGYGRVARIVALHTDIQSKSGPLDEADLVHLADKLVKGELLVSLEERFDGPLKKFAGRPDVLRAVGNRLEIAKKLRKRLEDLSGVAVREIIEKVKSGLQTASGGRRRIYLARHGAVVHRGDIKRYIGQTDLPLSTEGVRQAEMLAEKLKDTELAAIYCSDLRRSVDTAQTVSRLHGLRPIADPRLRELSLGEWEGFSFDEVRTLFPAEYEERGRDIVNYRPSGGESFLDCARRVMPALYGALGATGGDILIVGHAGVNRILLCHALGKPIDEIFDIDQDYGCLNLIQYSDFAFELEILNEIPGAQAK
ncbi:MAG TPA: histidine phosphatase family protein [Syntrophobacteraceae bacterium]|nr:histidine phosphatase family protein [Syntrophobacteraceae bacterium]